MSFLKRALAAALCGVMLMTLVVPVSTDFEVVEEPETVPETHVHTIGEDHAAAGSLLSDVSGEILGGVAVPFESDAPNLTEAQSRSTEYPNAEDQTPEHYRTVYNKSGLVVKSYVKSGHFSSEVSSCEAPDFYMISTKKITNVEIKHQNTSAEEESTLEGATPQWFDEAEQKFGWIDTPDATEGYITLYISLDGVEKPVKVRVIISCNLGYRTSVDYAATCTVPAHSVYRQYCSICTKLSYESKSQVKDAVAAGHKLEPLADERLACGNETIQKCSVCGWIEVKGLQEDSHNWASEPTVIPATCTTDGVQYTACQDCGAVKDISIIPAIDHNYPGIYDPNNTVVEPECDKNGYIEMKCANNCGSSVKMTRYATGHNWVLEGEYTELPICGQKPGKGKAKCTKCGTVEENHEFSRTSHVYVTVTTDATCTAPGKTETKCKYCGYSQVSKEIPQLPHTPEDIVDCTQPVMCAVCGTQMEDGMENHNLVWDSSNDKHWKKCKNPGCDYVTEVSNHDPRSLENPCQLSYKCETCSRRVSATYHEWSPIQKIDDDTHGSVCLKCGTTKSVSAHDSGISVILRDDGDCTTPVYCSCGEDVIIKAAQQAHRYTTYIKIEGNELEHTAKCSIVACKQSITEPHDFKTTVIEHKDATCDDAGYTVTEYRCTKCGYSKTERVELPAGHKWSDVITEEMTGCVTTPGQYKYCTVCYDRYVISEGVSTHTFPEGQYTIDKEPTCHTEGSKSIHCSVCGEATTAFETIPATGAHVWDYEHPVSLTESTCTTQGSATYRCKTDGCGATTSVTLALAEHTWLTDYIYLEDATCQHGGHKSRMCGVCKYSDIVDDPTHPAVQHDFRNYVYNNDAGIEKDGTETAECAFGCGKTDTRTAANTAIAGHSFVKYEIITPATCTEDAIEQAVCEVCKIATDTRPRPGTALGHEYVTSTLKEATCTDSTVIQKQCSRCADRIEEILQDTATGHEFGPYVYDDNATEASDGTETATCVKCGEKSVRRKEGTMLTQHSFTKYNEIVTPATCTEDAMVRAYCDNGCGSYMDRAEPGTALGHRYGAYKPDNNAACTENGTETATCEVCHATDTREILNSALGHDWGPWSTVDMPDCDDSGTESRSCNRCGFTETNGLVASGHKFDENNWIVDTLATCTEDGSRSVKCDVCGAIIKSEVIAKLGHSFVTYVDDGNATCTQNGTETSTCERCTATQTREKPSSTIPHEYDETGTCKHCGHRRVAPNGDLNTDGKTNVMDGVMMQRILSDLEDKSKFLLVADFNFDGVIDVKDGVYMQRLLAQL